MDLNKKIEQIIVDKGISPSYFADAIGVQRSSISHILSGRNKPSLDLIQKILKIFPDIDRDWLLFDSDMPAPRTLQNGQQPANFQRFNNQNLFESSPRESAVKNKPEERPVQTTVKRKIERPVLPPQPNSVKQVERIVIFYTDGTFMESKPM